VANHGAEAVSPKLAASGGENMKVDIKREVYTRAKDFAKLHNHSLSYVATEAIDYYLKTVGEAETEMLTDKSGGEVN
jgi:hypothetical protein